MQGVLALEGRSWHLHRTHDTLMQGLEGRGAMANFVNLGLCWFRHPLVGGLDWWFGDLNLRVNGKLPPNFRPNRGKIPGCSGSSKETRANFGDSSENPVPDCLKAASRAGTAVSTISTLATEENWGIGC